MTSVCVYPYFAPCLPPPRPPPPPPALPRPPVPLPLNNIGLVLHHEGANLQVCLGLGYNGGVRALEIRN